MNSQVWLVLGRLFWVVVFVGTVLFAALADGGWA